MEFEQSISNINCLENDISTNFNTKDIAKDIRAYFSSLAENVEYKLPNLQINDVLSVGNTTAI